MDFLDRIAVFVLTIPALRECKEDLPDAWRRVLSDASRSAGVAPAGWESFAVHPILLEAIANHPLPGNFRDLQRAAYHLLAALTGARPEAKVLDGAIAALGTREVSPHAAPNASVFAALLPIEDVRATVAAYERAWLDAAISKATGNVSEASRLLGIPRKTFEYRLRTIMGGKDKDSEE